MELNEAAAYATACWNRYEGAVSDDLLRALCGAFALVATADGDLAESEVEEFSAVVRDYSSRFPKLDEKALVKRFREIGEAMISDPEAGKQRALEDVGLVRDSEVNREIVRTAAELAMVVDKRVFDSERAALEEVNEALGLT